MSDKTKMLADQARIARKMAEQKARDLARGDQRPRCLCGFTYTDRIVLAVSDPSDRVRFYCQDCGPPDVQAHISDMQRQPQ